MSIKRRDFINLSAMAAATTVVAGISSCSNGQAKEKKSPVDELKSMTGDVVPITVTERETRIEKARGLLSENKINALILDCGTSLQYFTGISWWPSERTMVAIIPAKGDIKYVCLLLKRVVFVNKLKLEKTSIPGRKMKVPTNRSLLH
jgi:Xaa-Pro dipeptidase